MSLRKALLAATLLSLPLAAQAQPVTGLYIGAGVGGNYRDTTNDALRGAVPTGVVNPRVTQGAARFDQSYHWGFAGALSLGWGFGNGLRAELEGNFRQNDIDKVRTARGAFSPTGYARTYGVMGNVFYDFNMVPALTGIPLIPYIGAGAGYAWTNNDKVGGVVSGVGVPAGTRIISNSTDGQFAYQGIGGIAFPIASVPGLAITAEYRYFATLDPTLNYGIRTNYGTSAALGGSNRLLGTARVKESVENHSIMVGVRYNFGVAPPPPPPVAPAAVAPAPARTYLVFFDWDRSDLTARAREIIAEAARNSRTQQVTRLEVNGYTDRSGTTQYNQGLSLRRANAVAAQLVRDGVPRGAISIHAFGESNPLVPTADGVREPQNRRVEIILR